MKFANKTKKNGVGRQTDDMAQQTLLILRNQATEMGEKKQSSACKRGRNLISEWFQEKQGAPVLEGSEQDTFLLCK